MRPNQCPIVRSRSGIQPVPTSPIAADWIEVDIGTRASMIPDCSTSRQDSPSSANILSRLGFIGSLSVLG
jgi:hypothetical protein